MAFDQLKHQAFLDQVVADLGATYNAALIVLGEKLGLYHALDGAGPLSSRDLAERTGMAERYVREWLCAQAAGGYVTYGAATDRYELPAEHADALAHMDSPAYLPGAYQGALAALKIEPLLAERMRNGEGVGWHEHHPDLFQGVERFFRPLYAAHLVQEWIPALSGVEARLEAGACVADVGCGHGASTIIMAQRYPRSIFRGFDFHAPSIDYARRAGDEAGVSDRARFEVATSTAYPGTGYDVVTFFDCLHDMGDPVGAAVHVHRSLAPEGTWMIVEPYAGDDVATNLTPVGRIYYCASTLVCTPASLSQEVGLALGAQAGETRLREVVTGGGFTQFRRATETPFNLVFEAKP